MKKLMYLMASAALLFTFAACDPTEDHPTPSDTTGNDTPAFLRIDDTDYDYSDEILTVYATAGFGNYEMPYSVGLLYNFADPDTTIYPTVGDTNTTMFNVMEYITDPTTFDEDHVYSLTHNEDGSYSIVFGVPMWEGPIYYIRGYLLLESGSEPIYTDAELFMPSAKK